MMISKINYRPSYSDIFKLGKKKKVNKINKIKNINIIERELHLNKNNQDQQLDVLVYDKSNKSLIKKMAHQLLSKGKSTEE